MIATFGSFVPMSMVRRGVQRLIDTEDSSHDSVLLTGIGRAFYWQHLLDVGVVTSGSDIARKEGLDPSVVNELLRLTLLSPDILCQFMLGQQPRRLTLMWFQRNRVPVDWDSQRQIITSFE